MSTTDNVVEINEELDTKFRLFNRIVHEWHDFPLFKGVRFHIRPMTFPERSRLDSAEQRVFQYRDLQGAIEKAGVSKEELSKIYKMKEDSDIANSEEMKSVSRIMNSQAVEVDEEEKFFLEARQAILACVDKIEIDGEEESFTAEQFDSIKVAELSLWLITTIRKNSTLARKERLSL